MEKQPEETVESNPSNEGSGDASDTLIEDARSSSPASAMAKEVRPGFFVVCEGNSCTPYITENSGSENPAAFLQDNFEAFDKDRNGYVSQEELSKTANHFKEGTAPRNMIDRLMKQESKIADLNNDEYGKEDNGISEKDIAKMNQLIDRYKADRTGITQPDRDLVDSVLIKKKKVTPS